MTLALHVLTLLAPPTLSPSSAPCNQPAVSALHVPLAKNAKAVEPALPFQLARECPVGLVNSAGPTWPRMPC
jgi:hypothetical protein